jgi:hypothetical protein
MDGVTVNGRYQYHKKPGNAAVAHAPEEPLLHGKPLGHFPQKESPAGATKDAKHPVVNETIVKAGEHGAPDAEGKGLESTGKAYGAKQDDSGKHVAHPKTVTAQVTAQNASTVKTKTAAQKLYPVKRGLKGREEGTD